MINVLTCNIPYSCEYNSTHTSTRVLCAIFWVSIFNRYCMRDVICMHIQVPLTLNNIIAVIH